MHMATKRKKTTAQQQKTEEGGMFRGMRFYLVRLGVQPRRLQIWEQKLLQMGAVIEDDLSDRVTHILAIDSNNLYKGLTPKQLKGFKGSILQFEWLERSLKSGETLPESYTLDLGPGRISEFGNYLNTIDSKPTRGQSDDESATSKRDTLSDESSKAEESRSDSIHVSPCSTSGKPCKSDYHSSEMMSSLYLPHDLNQNITEIFGELVNIYRALGDDQRSFSYHKAIPVIEKLPFKIENVDQVKDLPTIGKSLLGHIQEIVATGKLSKLEHFKTDEKVQVVSLFGEVWGIGPATALKLYDKGYRTFKDLEEEQSLTNAQRFGLKYFEDIKKKIPRDEVKEMEDLLQKTAEAILPGVKVVCGGSYRRGKGYCGDLDIIITHPDGQSHKGFLHKYVLYLKDIKFLREDLVFSVHSIQGTDTGVDTYFGLCTYAGREQRHRVDLKVYPRDMYAFGLIAWTGNDVLNRRLRLLAESKGYRLDDTGLYFATQTSGGKRVMLLIRIIMSAKPPSFSCMTEKEVFDILGFPWLEPHERNL